MRPSPNRIGYYRDRSIPPLTQATLAQALGKHINSIQLWEKQGVPNPADLLRLLSVFIEHGAISDYATATTFWEVSGRQPFNIPPELRELCDWPDLRLMPANMPTDRLPPHAAPPSISRMPLHRNRLFVGRADELFQLAVALGPIDATVVICGLAGMGKTQLASELVHRYGHYFFGGVFWISFADEDAVAASVMACGRREHLHVDVDFDLLPFDQQLRLVQAAWREPTPRLLIFDNCEDEALLQHWRPTIGGCRVLVTSRRARWDATLVSKLVPLRELQRAESIALLRGHNLERDAPDHELDALAAEVGDLPLALHLSGKYLARNATLTPQAYVSQLRCAYPLEHQALQGGGISPTDHHQHLARAFAVSYERLDLADHLDALALRLLARAAHFAAGELLPQALLVAALEIPADDAATALQAKHALLRLIDLGLLELVGAEDGALLRIHRLLVVFVQMNSADLAAQSAVERVILAEAQRLNEERHPAPMLALQPQLRAVTNAALLRADELAAELATAFGWQLVLLFSFAAGQHYLQQALAMRETLFGANHPKIATNLNRLALLHQFQGDFAAARPFYERALAIWEQAYGPDHPDTANGYNNLGYLLCFQGDYATALRYLTRSLAFRRRTPGLRDQETARTVNNLGYVMLRQGHYRAARRYLKLALAIRQQMLPPENSATAQTLNNLGEAYYAQADYDRARHYHKQALLMRKALFGPAHAHVAESLKNLALLRRSEGDLRTARTYLEQAVAMCRATIGDQHIETIWNCALLAELLYEQGELTAAQTYFKQVLAVYTVQLIPGHPDIARVHDRLATIERWRRGS